MRVVVLAGGVGGAKFAGGVRAALREDAPVHELTIVVNIGDDMWLSGLKVCPDLDSMMYGLAGVHDQQRGWGRAQESARVSAELSAYGVGWPWFTLEDLDLGTHIARTGLLHEGSTLSEATAHLAARWELGARLLPASDQELETWVELDPAAGEGASVHLEEWWVRLRARVPARRFHQRTSGPEPTAAPGVVEAIESADVVLVAPSNPVVSIGTICGFPGADGAAGVPGIPGIREAVERAAAPVVGVSPIIGDAPVRGMATQCLAALGQPVRADAVGLAYGARTAGGLLDSWLIDVTDADSLDGLRAAGLAADAVPLLMHDADASAALARETLRMAGVT